ncbi:MAG: hypothetical protein ACXVB1_18135 [Pseudobdellovibrionaceae bacterium]
MKKPTGRPAKHPIEFMMTVAEQIAKGHLTYRQAARRYGASHGSIALWMVK